MTFILFGKFYYNYVGITNKFKMRNTKQEVGATVADLSNVGRGKGGGSTQRDMHYSPPTEPGFVFFVFSYLHFYIFIFIEVKKK